MRERITAIGWFYLIASIWFVVTAGFTLALVGPMDVLFSAVGVSPMLSAMLTTGIAGVLAAMVAGLLWMRVRARREPATRRAVEDAGLRATPIATSSSARH